MTAKMTRDAMIGALGLIERLKRVEEARWSVAAGDFDICEVLGRPIKLFNAGAFWRIAAVIEIELRAESHALLAQLSRAGIDTAGVKVAPPHPIPRGAEK